MANIQYLSQFPSIFSQRILNELVKNGESKKLSRFITESQFLEKEDKIKYGDLFDNIFNYLLKNYRCEYVYKNLLANELLLARHSLNSSSIITELRVGNAKADVVILNGTSTVYEIKTELDNFDRLNHQLEEYKKFFDKIFIVTHHSIINKISNTFDEGLGLIQLSEDHKIETLREAKSNKGNVIPLTIFDSFRKNEYTKIILDYFGYIPEVPNTRIYTECKELFGLISPSEAHDIMVEVLRTRSSKEKYENRIRLMPDSLRLLVLESQLKDQEYLQLEKAFNSNFEFFC
ncbi:MAG: sce7726 family protein [Tissierellales bacterium]|nr:sce7726 family protein [Tissierellales bacterium]